MNRRSILLVLLSVALMIGAPPLRGEEFYASQLRLGFDALAAGETTRAGEHCRIAAFGLLDQPPQLSSALVCVALASSAGSRTQDLTHALERFLTIESRFAVYAKAPVPDAFRRAFDALLVTHVDRERLAAIASLASVGQPQRPPERVVVAEPVEETPAPARVVEEPPVEVPIVEVEIVEPEAVATQEPVVEEPAAPVEEAVVPAAPPEHLDAEDAEADRVLTAARRLINRRRPGDAAKIAYRQLAKTPARRDLRLTLLEAATLDEDWRTAAAQTDLLQPFAEGEEVSMFYAAVALFESGRKSDARRLVARSKDVVPKTDYVKYYTQRIESMQ